MRYAPTRQVLGGTSGTVDLSNDAFDIAFKDTITNQAGDFAIQLDDRIGRYSRGTYATLAKFQPVKISLDGELLFKGRIDQTTAIVDKAGALVYEIQGRSDFATLVDIIASKHAVQETAHTIVNEIIDLQNSLAQSQDPQLTLALNGADDTVPLNFLWKRSTLQKMLLDVSNKLASPVTQGGIDQFYDFWVDPTDGFWFVPAGSVAAAGVDLGYPGGVEQKQRKYFIDANPVKNDVWTWAQNTAAGAGLGRIPLSMQPGYVWDPAHVGQLYDSWTEGNASDYTAGTNLAGNPYDVNVATIGTASIGITTTPLGSGDVAYFSMKFPFGSGGSKWAGQPPSSAMNTYNETSMTETMGQMAALIYYLRVAPETQTYGATLKHYVELVDAYGNVADSVSQPILATTQAWQAVAVAFGPDSNYSQGSGVFFDWASVAEIRYCFTMQDVIANSVYDIFFDGFAIVKPLVVETAQSGATTRRTFTQTLSGILTYADALNYGKATLESLMMPQQYYEIQNIGRNDIPAGYTFTSEGKTLVAKELSYKYNKHDGWLIDLNGWEAT